MSSSMTSTPTGDVIIQYNKGGGAQKATLTFDEADDFAGASLDRSVFPQNAEVHVDITDAWLNIDPTDEDSWTFTVNADNENHGLYYQVFDENGKFAYKDGDNVHAQPVNLKQYLDDLMCGDCILIANPNTQNAANAVLTLQDNDNNELSHRGNSVDNIAQYYVKGIDALGAGSAPVTVTENDPKSGVFTTYDESDVSALKVTSNALRGTSATLDYNDSPATLLVGYSTATINIEPTDDTWNSGEAIPIAIVDADANVNSRIDEDLELTNPDLTIPALITGDPFTLGERESDNKLNVLELTGSSKLVPDNAALVYSAPPIPHADTLFSTSGSNPVHSTAEVDIFSKRAIIAGGHNFTSSPTGLIIDFESSVKDLRESIHDNRSPGTEKGFAGYNFLNYDFRSYQPTNLDLFLLIGNTTALIDDSGTLTAKKTVRIVNDGDAQALVSLEDSSLKEALFNSTILSPSANIGLLAQFESGLGAGIHEKPIVADFFSFGFKDDGVQATERVANQIIRIEAEESGDNTSSFEGSLEYVMLNQLNINEEGTYSGLSTISDEVSLIVMEDLTDEDAVRVSYNDLAADGGTTPISAQEDAPSHNGVVSLNQDTYKIADTVVITLTDLDLNVDPDLIDIYTTVGIENNNYTDPDNDQVGKRVADDNLKNLSFGSLGRLLDVTFDDQRWQNHGGSCNPDGYNGLKATGFSLVETGASSGVFTGDFLIPSQWCRAGDASPITTTGLDIEVNYVDFRDASGEIIEVGDSAGVGANTGSISPGQDSLSGTIWRSK